MSEDRRRHQRLHNETHVTIQRVTNPARPEQEDSLLYCDVKDFSKGGMQIEAPCDYPVGAGMRMVMRICPPVGLPLELMHLGKVRWTRTAEDDSKFNMGIEFTHTTDDSMRHWVHYVSQIERLNSEPDELV